MTLFSENTDCFNLNGGKKSDIENITSHKIAVVVFIREFCLLKQNRPPLPPKYRKDFCMLVLKLIQCPDLKFNELETLIRVGKYDLLDSHMPNFCLQLKRIYEEGVSALMDCVSDAVEKLMVETQVANPCIISKSSVLGLYLRRMMLYLDKLSFSQVTAVYRVFCSYYERSVYRIDEIIISNPDPRSDCPMVELDKQSEIPIGYYTKKKAANISLDDDNEEQTQWSRKQAELFTAQQAALLQTSEPRALHPPRMQNIISQIVRDNPDYAEAHFLSYLNCLRERELCGAMDSLYGCFDRSAGGIGSNSHLPSERNKGFRYASLNLAVLHAQFGHKEQALTSLKEAIVMSQEAGDSVCLQQAAGWARRVGGSGGLAASHRPPRAPTSCARHRAALAAQSYVQHATARRVTPAHLFGLMMKGDVVHCQHSFIDLVQASLANRAALWSLYGKTEMASFCCQLLLNLNTGGLWECESACLAACGVAQVLSLAGEGIASAAVLQHARARAPRPPHCLLWMRTQYIITANDALLSGQWQEAEQAAHQLASVDRWESQLIKAELHFLKGEPNNAMTCLNDVLDHCESQDDSKMYLTLRIKAMILAAQIENSCSGIYATSSVNITMLNEALSLAVDNFLDYQAAIIEMHVANVQLQLGCVTNALAIAQRVLATIMAHGGPYDRARGMLLYVKCRIASAPKIGERRRKVMSLCTELLEKVKDNFNRVKAVSRLKDVVYLQAQLYHEVGNISERNKCALEYRQIDEQHPTKQTNSLLTCF